MLSDRLRQRLVHTAKKVSWRSIIISNPRMLNKTQPRDTAYSLIAPNEGNKGHWFHSTGNHLWESSGTRDIIAGFGPSYYEAEEKSSRDCHFPALIYLTAENYVAAINQPNTIIQRYRLVTIVALRNKDMGERFCPCDTR